MKKLFLALSIFLAGIIPNSCSFGGLFMTDKEMANARMDTLLSAMQNKDKDKIKGMFSINALVGVENFDDSLDDLLVYFQGDFIFRSGGEGLGVGDSINYGDKTKYMEATYDVETSERVYRFAFYDVTIDTLTPQNIGFRSLYIIRKEDDTDTQSVYRGDGKYTPGINIGIPTKAIKDRYAF